MVPVIVSTLWKKYLTYKRTFPIFPSSESNVLSKTLILQLGFYSGGLTQTLFHKTRFELSSILTILLVVLTGVGCDSPTTFYNATIAEGTTAANEMLEQTGSASVSVAFVADGKVVWAEGFGYADRATSTRPNAVSMYNIGSTGKMISTTAVMMLVDQELVNLERPVIDYLPDFSMLSPEYAQVTVHMLLNHSSGFPGSDYRNTFTSGVYEDYHAQVLASLSEEHLKAPPGYMNVSCNDGFSLIESLVPVVTGRNYPEFIQEEILSPLGMDHSRLPPEVVAPGTSAYSYTGDDQDPQAFINAYAAGGLYSTPTDMATWILMILGDGKLGNTRILSEEAIEAMSVDQTVGTFNPVKSDNNRFGIGWDTITDPAFQAVDVEAWAKGGDVQTYGTYMIVLPQQGMGVVVTGASQFTSSNARVIAERILLRALVEKGAISSMPEPLPALPRPVEEPTDEKLSTMSGYFATSGTIYRIDANSDKTISFFKFTSDGWTETPHTRSQMRDDGLFSMDAKPLTELGAVSAGGSDYIFSRNVGGYGNVQDDMLYLEKIVPASPISEAWAGRTTKTWLQVNNLPDTLDATAKEPRLSLYSPEGMTGFLAAGAHDGSYFLEDPSKSDTLATMYLILPQTGRDLNDVFIVDNDGEEWIRFGSNVYRPQDGVSELANSPVTVTIGDDGYAEWRKFPSESVEKIVTVTTQSVWRVFDSNLTWIETLAGSDSASLPAASGDYYLLFYGSPGDEILVEANASS